MKNPGYILILSFLFLSWHLIAGAGNDTAFSKIRDTSSIRLKQPPAADEKKIFSGSGFDYRQKSTNTDGRDLSEWALSQLDNNANQKTSARIRNAILWIVVIAAILAAVWLLWRSEITGLTRGKSKSLAFNFADVTEDLDSINFEKRINEAVSSNNFRLATRWLYLKLLYDMDKQKIIQFVPYKTNIDYRYEIKSGPLLEEFTKLSRIYEYVWYGKFEISETGYQANAGNFTQLEKLMNV